MSKNNNSQNQNPNPIFIMAPPSPPQPQPQDNGIFGGLGGIVLSAIAGLLLGQVGLPQLPGNIKF